MSLSDKIITHLSEIGARAVCENMQIWASYQKAHPTHPRPFSTATGEETINTATILQNHPYGRHICSFILLIYIKYYILILCRNSTNHIDLFVGKYIVVLTWKWCHLLLEKKRRKTHCKVLQTTIYFQLLIRKRNRDKQ